MKTHNLKLDAKYFDDVKSGKKNFEIRKNNDFNVGDILELKLYHKKAGYLHAFKAIDSNKLETGSSTYYEQVSESKADTIRVKVLNIIPSDEYNNFEESIKGIPQSIKWANSYHETYIKTINGVLNDYFSVEKLPDDYVVLGIEVTK